MEIIYEDSTVLVVLKPFGLVVNRAKTVGEADTLQDQLEAYFGVGESREGVGGRAGIVHRLDKDTSGVLVVAKSEEAFSGLQAQFRKRTVEKEYLVLVHGKVREKEGVVEAPIARHRKDRKKFAVVAGGREAKTDFRQIALYRLVSGSKERGEEEAFSYLLVRPETGRTHQIRVHLKHLRHPIVADPLYLTPRRLKKDRLWCPRLFLHAKSIGFKHPKSGSWLRVEADLPQDLTQALGHLKRVL
jgi:23S rRNA pseudouridine1911/1915/1917 synthase